jgi:uncharacterized glyoxalase superfamily protein PhnB
VDRRALLAPIEERAKSRSSETFRVIAAPRTGIRLLLLIPKEDPMTQTFFPSLRYRDAPAALEWLAAAFGFEKTAEHPNDDGTIAHAEMTFGGQVIMLGSERNGDRFGTHVGQEWTYVAVDDPDALYERARAAGAEVVMEITDQDYGSRDFSVHDPEGNLWSFGTYRPQSA